MPEGLGAQEKMFQPLQYTPVRGGAVAFPQKVISHQRGSGRGLFLSAIALHFSSGLSQDQGELGIRVCSKSKSHTCLILRTPMPTF